MLAIERREFMTKAGGVALFCALAVSLYAAATAFAAHYHTNCVGHGFVHGSSTTDNAFHARVEAGCGNPGSKNCVLRSTNGAIFIASHSIAAGVNQGCNAFSNYGFWERSSKATVDFNGVFVSHDHFPH